MVTCPRPPLFRSAKQILVVSFATQERAFILSDRNIFYTPRRGEEQRRGLMPLGLFLLSSGLVHANSAIHLRARKQTESKNFILFILSGKVKNKNKKRLIFEY